MAFEVVLQDRGWVRVLHEEDIPDGGVSMKKARSRRWVWESLKTSGFLQLERKYERQAWRNQCQMTVALSAKLRNANVFL